MGPFFRKARYMNGVGFEILARTPVPKLTLSYPPPTPPPTPERFPYNPKCTSLMCDDLKENLQKKKKKQTKKTCNHHVQTSLLICAICRKFWPVSLANLLGNTTLTIVWECAMSGVLQYAGFSHSLSARFGKSKWIISLKKRHMRRAKAQIRLRMCTVCTWPSLSAHMIGGYGIYRRIVENQTHRNAWLRSLWILFLSIWGGEG